jgi:hypothetical protein
MVFLPLVGSVLGVVFGHLGLKAVDEGTATNRGLALAGAVVGYIGLGLTVVVTILVGLVTASFSGWFLSLAVGEGLLSA